MSWGLALSGHLDVGDRDRLVGLGYAEADTLTGQPDDALKNSSYFLGNVLYSLNDRMMLGLEYNHGERENLDGHSLDNHRFVLGLQVF